MKKINLETFDDGYILTHNDVDYKYKGKSDDAINMISDKIKELLKKDRDKTIADITNKILKGE